MVSAIRLPRLLDFAIVGAAKSGTSSLSALMDAHTRMHVLNPKDGHPMLAGTGMDNWQGPRDAVFNNKIATSGQQYADQLEELAEGDLAGDASVFYMTDRAAMENLHRNLTAEAPVVAVLRRPEDRAYSAYMHMVREGLEDETFADGLAKEADRRKAGWQPIWWYRELGRYHEQVATLFEVFGPERVHVVLYDELTADPASALSSVYTQLGIGWEPVGLTRNNASGVPKSRTVQRFLSEKNALKTLGRRVVPRSLWLRARSRLEKNNLERVPMDSGDRARLRQYFDEDVAALAGLIGRDLTGWRS